MNLLEIIVLIVIAGIVLSGYRKGFVRKLASMVSFVLSIVLVSVFLPYMTDFLKNSTPVYDYIVKQCRQVVTEQVTEALVGSSEAQSGNGKSGTSQLDMYRNMGREQIKSLMDQYGYDSTVVDTLTDAQLEEYKEQFIEEYLGDYLGISDTESSGQSSEKSAGTLWQPTRIEQTELLENLPVPEVLRDLLLDYNNADGYASLGVSTFQDYVIHFIATIILNVISFVAALLAVQLVLRAAIAALDIISHIPLLGGVNRLLGLLLGLLQALFFVWIFFLILSMTSTTEIGLQLMSMVQQSRLLGYLYDANLFMTIVVQAASLFV